MLRQRGFLLNPFRFGGAAANYSATVLSDNPRAYYRLGEATGTVAANSSGLGASLNGAYVNSPTQGVSGLITGDPDKAVLLNGSTQRISTASALLNTASGNAFSIEAVLRFDVAPGPEPGVIVGAGISSGTASDIEIRVNATGGVDVLRTNVVLVVSSAATFSVGSKHHYVLTRGTDNVIRQYLDGVLDANTATFSGFTSSGNVWLIGASQVNTSPTFTRFFNGVMDEVAVYQSQLSGARISAHYAAGV